MFNNTDRLPVCDVQPGCDVEEGEPLIVFHGLTEHRFVLPKTVPSFHNVTLNVEAADSLKGINRFTEDFQEAGQQAKRIGRVIMGFPKDRAFEERSLHNDQQTDGSTIH